MSWVVSGTYKGAAVSDADAQAYLRAVETADNQGPLEQGVQQAVNQFVIGCKSDGIWTAIKASCILAGARTLAGALVPLAGTAPTNVGPFVSGDYNRKTGLDGDGSTKYLNSGRNSNADPQNSKHLAIYVSTANTLTANKGYIGATSTGTTGSAHIFSNSGSNVITARVNSTTATNFATGAATGFIGASRNVASDVVVRGAGSSATASATSDGLVNENILVFGRGGIAQADGRLAFYSIGESLDLALLDARVSDLITAIAAAIP